MISPYPHLLAPLTLGPVTLKNRVIMGSMHSRLEMLDRPAEREIAFYVERAKGGAAMLITSGFAPNEEGRIEEGAHIFSESWQVPEHRALTDAVHAHGAAMLLQILHAGRYAKHDHIVGPGTLRSPINKRVPREMTEDDIERTIGDFVRTATLARDAGYEGVEIMGSEGYLITQFVTPRSNRRTDRWGGSIENRCRMPVEIVRRTRQALGPGFLIMYRISALDLVEEGLDGVDVDFLARAVEAAGADVLSTGVGWHEAPVPTISFHVPRAAWRFAAGRLKRVVGIPVVASNRINTPEVAESLIAAGEADLVALARPLLADPDFVNKAAAGRADEINTCIACNQACLDYIFSDRAVSCLVNPRAGRELDFSSAPAAVSRKVAVVGAGPAGLACAIEAARQGHRVDLYEASSRIGGQLNLARRIPEKTEFNELIRYFDRQVTLSGLNLRLGHRVTSAELEGGAYDRIVVGAGIAPRLPDIPGIDHPMVVGYADILSGRRVAGRRVAIIGTGGIGHDVAEYLLGDGGHMDDAGFFHEWGVDTSLQRPGGLTEQASAQPKREVTLFQRTPGRVGGRLGVSTGWVLRGQLKKRGVESVAGCTYVRIDDLGLHYVSGGESRVAEVDTVVICAGQEPARGLVDELAARGIEADLIGGARFAGELDAVRAIDEGTRLALSI
jgi:2,4-dienoyl-CoA reductase (NADPH2)